MLRLNTVSRCKGTKNRAKRQISSHFPPLSPHFLTPIYPLTSLISARTSLIQKRLSLVQHRISLVRERGSLVRKRVSLVRASSSQIHNSQFPFRTHGVLTCVGYVNIFKYIYNYINIIRKFRGYPLKTNCETVKL